MTGHSLEREAREAIAARRRPMAEPADRRLRLGREEVKDFFIGLFVLALWFVALFYALPIIAEGMR